MKTKRTKKQDKHASLLRFDTKISVFEKEYKVDLGMSKDMELGKYFEIKGYPSFAKMLKE